MEIIKDITKVQWDKTSVTLGKFDGVHLGHRMLMENVLEATANSCTPTVFTFDKPSAKEINCSSNISILPKTSV